MTEKVTHGSMGGGWRPGMAVRVRHRQPKGTANGWAGLQPRRQPSTLLMRNLLAHVPKQIQAMVAAIIRTIFVQPDAALTREQLEKVADGLRRRSPRLHRKDLGIALAMGRAVSVPLLATALVHELLGMLEVRGQGDWDYSDLVTPTRGVSSGRRSR